MSQAIDLNADLGEGFGVYRLTDDEALVEVVTSASVACGFHAGDPATMQRVCQLAARRGVAIGAQVSYHDRVGFGRRALEIDAAELTADVLYQLGALQGFAQAAGARVAYVKPHGALYTRAAFDVVQAEAVVAAVTAFDPHLAVLGLPGSVLLACAGAAGLPTVGEAFPDRAYTAAGRLADRRTPGALVVDPAEVAARAVRMVTWARVRTPDGEEVVLEPRPRSLCVHGDTPGAVGIARAVRAALREAGVHLAAFA